jgi:hypothetical protein
MGINYFYGHFEGWNKGYFMPWNKKKKASEINLFYGIKIKYNEKFIFMR